MRTSTSRLLVRWSMAMSVLGACIAIGGCASMNKNECLTADWRTIGYEDGVSGHAGNRIANHREACAKHGVTPNLSAYQAGRDDGLREFCKPDNGFRAGARGYSYGGVCPADMEGRFLGAYETGRQLHTLRSRVANAAGRIDSMRNEMDRIDDNLIKSGAEIMKSETTGERRAQLVLDMKRMAERRGTIKTEIPQLEVDLAHYQRELDDFRAHLAYVE